MTAADRGSNPADDPTSAALYVGSIGHRRTEGVGHAFNLDVFYAYLDVETVDSTLARVPGWSSRWPAPMRFRREDYLDGSNRPLGDAVRDLVADRTGERPDGPVSLLTQVRALGFVFNPISVYFCWSHDGSRIDALVLEVTNTPWKQRCWYVLSTGAAGTVRAWRFPKRMHVSPFLDMDLTYVVRLDGPDTGDGRIRLRIEDRRDHHLVLSADLDLARVPLDARQGLLVPLRHPLQTWRVFAAIHVHAMRLWRKGLPVHRRPVAIVGSEPHESLSRSRSPSPTSAPSLFRRLSHGQHGTRRRRPHRGPRRTAPSAGRVAHHSGAG